MAMEDYRIRIREKIFSIEDQYTLIKGTFTNDDLSLSKDLFFEYFTDFIHIDLKHFIEYFREYNLIYEKIKYTMNLLDYLQKFKESTEKNREHLNQYVEISTSLTDILNYMKLKQEIQNKKNELKIAEFKKESNEISAKSNLIDKLRRSIKDNQKRLDYFNEDFLKIKNQRDQIKNTIKSNKEKINELNRKKKENFDMINKITREMESGKGENITQKIIELRKEAKTYHYDASDLQKQMQDLKNRLENIDPKYNSTKQDFENLTKEIDIDKAKLKEFEKELNNLLNEENETKEILQEPLSNYSMRTPSEIKEQLSILEDQFSYIQKKSKYIENQKISLTKFDKKIEDFNNLMNKSENYEFNPKFDDLERSIESYSNIEIIIEEIEDKLNKFLSEVNLRISISLCINKDLTDFFLELEFIRLKKEQINFKNLTTPEKVFFVIIFYITLNILKKEKNVIFTNLMLPDEFNKRGSLYRTIRKIIPIFASEKELKEYSLAFLISNLEMKRPIDNIKIITI